jgi:hypothetical protein
MYLIAYFLFLVNFTVDFSFSAAGFSYWAQGCACIGGLFG